MKQGWCRCKAKTILNLRLSSPHQTARAFWLMCRWKMLWKRFNESLKIFWTFELDWIHSILFTHGLGYDCAVAQEGFSTKPVRCRLQETVCGALKSCAPLRACALFGHVFWHLGNLLRSCWSLSGWFSIPLSCVCVSLQSLALTAAILAVCSIWKSQTDEEARSMLFAHCSLALRNP